MLSHDLTTKSLNDLILIKLPNDARTQIINQILLIYSKSLKGVNCFRIKKKTKIAKCTRRRMVATKVV